ncbi:hypothetical protein V2G26_004847 [Clonostachys chloroleuca]
MPEWLSSRRWSLRTRSEKRSRTPIEEKTGDITATPTPAKVQPEIQIPDTQAAVLLHAPKQPYQLTSDHPVPELLHENEILVRTRAIGLNPIDWKSPDFNFGIPVLPFLSGRELAGDVVRTNSKAGFDVGDRVVAISTDYRDQRKGAYQEYVVAPDYNVVRLPSHISYEEGSTVGVAFVAAALGLGVSMGVDFSQVTGGPDLFTLLRDIDESRIPADVRAESLAGIRNKERPKKGDWLAVWGGSSTSAHLTIQLAKLAGLRVVVMVDKAKHGLRISNHQSIRPDLLVDSHDPERAISIVKANTKGNLRFGLDTRGKETAEYLLRAISPESPLTKPGVDEDNLPTPPGTPSVDGHRSHLIGMSGLPKIAPGQEVLLHNVPIKLFHDVPEVGSALTSWLGRLLGEGIITLPDVLDVEKGFENINSGLDRMRRGEISGGKLVVKV